jgi:ABC-2 type transport system permease protein
MKFISGLQYRAAAWAGISTQFAWGFALIMLYKAFYASSNVELPMPWEQLVNYLWLQQAFVALIMLWSQDGDLLSQIVDGQVAYELCRPYDLFGLWYFRLLAGRLSSVLLRLIPLLIIALIIPAPYRLTLPPNLSAFGLFLLSMAFSALLVVAISMFIYILTFITLSSVGARLAVGVFSDFLMGGLIPIPLMPTWLQRILNWFPFRYIADLPFRLYSGNISGADALRQVAVQLVWLALLLIVGKLCFKRIFRNIVIQGG